MRLWCHNRTHAPFQHRRAGSPARALRHRTVAAWRDVAGFLDLIHDKNYFVLHAPRQTGKTSALLALRDLLNRGEAGDFRCVYVNVEVGQVARDDTARGMRSILSSLASNARLLGDDFPHRVWPNVLARAGPDDALKELPNGLVFGESDAVGAAGGRDRFAGGRHAALRAASAARGLSTAPRGISSERGAVRRARYSGLPNPHQFRRGNRRRQPVQRRRQIAAVGRFH